MFCHGGEGERISIRNSKKNYLYKTKNDSNMKKNQKVVWFKAIRQGKNIKVGGKYVQ